MKYLFKVKWLLSVESHGQVLLRLFAFRMLGCGLKDDSVFLYLDKITCQHKK